VVKAKRGGPATKSRAFSRFLMKKVKRGECFFAA
jgi:hypothetical protein